MELSEYSDENQALWNKRENAKVNELVEYLNKNIDDDLYKIAKSNDNIDVFSKLRLWLLRFHKKHLLEGLKYVEVDYEIFKRMLIYSLILGVTRRKSNVDLIYDILKSTHIIEKMMNYDDGTYEIVTQDFGNIQFIEADKNFVNDKETLDYIRRLENDIQSACHDISFYLIQNYDNFRAVTSICQKGLDNNYYHSFVLDDENNVIDFTSNLIMPKEQYYLLNDVKELNCIDYKEYLAEKNDSIEFDESKTLYNLLRNALYKQYLSEKNKSDSNER